MIKNDEQLRQSINQLQLLYSALASLRARILPLNPKQFALMAEAPLDEIRNIQREIDEYTGVLIVEEIEADVWLHIDGRGIHWPDAPTSVLTAFLDSFRKGIQSIAEIMSTGRLTTRPTTELKQACDLRVVAFQPGSLKVGIRLPDEDQPTLQFDDSVTVAHSALTKYLDVAAWVDSKDSLPDLDNRITDAQQRRLLLNSLKAITPRPRGTVESVEISGRYVPKGKPILLTRQAHQRIDNAIDHTVDHTVAEQVEMHIGDLREIDLDNASFILRNASDVREIRCTFEDDLLEIAKEALDRRVQVTGMRRTIEGRRPQVILRVTRLEIIDDRDEQINTIQDPDQRGLIF